MRVGARGAEDDGAHDLDEALRVEAPEELRVHVLRDELRQPVEIDAVAAPSRGRTPQSPGNWAAGHGTSSTATSRR